MEDGGPVDKTSLWPLLLSEVEESLGCCNRGFSCVLSFSLDCKVDCCFAGFLRSQTVVMGASESFPATPTCTPLLNKHLKHVNDPRSPTAGIPRTPIEVLGSLSFRTKDLLFHLTFPVYLPF